MVEFAATGGEAMKRFLYFVSAALFIIVARWLGLSMWIVALLIIFCVELVVWELERLETRVRALEQAVMGHGNSFVRQDATL